MLRYVPLLRRGFSTTPTPPASLIKELRVLSNSAPLLACRKALAATVGSDGVFSIEDALRELKKTEGAKTKSKTEGRTMGEGERRG